MRLAPGKLAPALALLVIFVPAPGHRVERNTAVDLARVRAAECEYRGISVSFEDLTRAYALKTYVHPRLARWEARPSPRNADTETLVTAVFTAGGLSPEGGRTEARRLGMRRRALPSFGVTWRLNNLAAARIEPHNAYARDALATFRATVDTFIAQMVLVTSAVSLRRTPQPEGAVVAALEAGAVLLQERQQEEWSYVRVPSSQTAGWIEKEHLRSLARAER